MSNFDWVNEREKEMEESRSKDYFRIVEGDNQFILLSHFAPIAQVFNPTTKKYEVAEIGDKNASIKGVCWVAQRDVVDENAEPVQYEWNVKQAKMPYSVIKMVRNLSQNDDWDFKLPFLHTLTINAVNAGSKEVKYSLTPSPKMVELPESVIAEYQKKMTPEEIVEKIKESDNDTEGKA